MSREYLTQLVIFCIEPECRGPVTVYKDVVIITRPRMTFFRFNSRDYPIYKCPKCGQEREIASQVIKDIHPDGANFNQGGQDGTK